MNIGSDAQGALTENRLNGDREFCGVVGEQSAAPQLDENQLAPAVR